MEVDAAGTEYFFSFKFFFMSIFTVCIELTQGTLTALVAWCINFRFESVSRDNKFMLAGMPLLQLSAVVIERYQQN